MARTLKLAAQTVLFSSFVIVNACVVDVGIYHYDFTSLNGTQVAFKSDVDQQTYVFTFCQVASGLCGTQQSSLCQTDPGGNKVNLGVWSTADNWKPGNFNLSGNMYGDSTWCTAPIRDTHVTFTCVNGPAKFISIVETASCKYEAVIEVPRVVCGNAPPCCTPDTYSATRIENDGTVAVVQADATAGNWYDSNFADKGAGLLCSRAYNRCFMFTATTCASAPYQPVPAQCYGTTQDAWTLVKQGLLVEGATTTQTAWFSKAANSYVITMPFGGAGFCVAVSGNKAGSSFEFSLTPNSTLWNVPPSCVKLSL